MLHHNELVSLQGSSFGGGLEQPDRLVKRLICQSESAAVNTNAAARPNVLHEGGLRVWDCHLSAAKGARVASR